MLAVGCQMVGQLAATRPGDPVPSAPNAATSAEITRLQSLLDAAAAEDPRRAEWLYEVGLLQLTQGTRNSQRDALGALNLLAKDFPGHRATEVTALTTVLKELIFLRRQLSTAEQQVTNRDRQLEAQQSELERQREALRRVTESVMGAEDGSTPAPAPAP